MKVIWEKLRGMGSGAWLLILCLCAGLCLVFPLSGEGNGDMTAEEKRISRTLSLIQGAGECRITLYYTETNGAFSEKSTPAGAVILSRGAGDIGVRLQLIRAAEALLGLPGERIEIFSMEETP